MLHGESSRRVAPPAAGSGGNIDALPNSILEHIVGLLISPEAVRTSMVAHRWRHLWKSAPSLRVGCSGDDVSAPPLNELREFVDRFLLLREGSPLDTCDIRLGQFQRDDMPLLNSWVRQAIACNAKALRLRTRGIWYLVLDDLPVVSKHLTRLELHRVLVHSIFLDFTSCLALEYLKLLNCDLGTARKISAESLKHLSIVESCFSSEFRTRIHTPNLVSLHFDGLKNLTPKLDSMPSLVEGVVRMTNLCFDFCVTESEEDTLDCLSRLSTNSRGKGVNSCVLFNGLSKAKSLDLICRPSDERRPFHLPGTQFLQILFIWDLRLCPMFSNLKTLLLNEYWCMPDDCSALLRILELSPVLEELTLELFSEGSNNKVEMNGSISLVERSPKISEHLNEVKVKCQAVDERVLKIFKILYTLNICFPL
ncbi:unnamed protein product [Urochloa decumbens]|uniref:F-box domain-containing protein n=1 Tax=Urochloa decumbens TaxID=240449 RepID=A0ABC9AS75_9POAL